MTTRKKRTYIFLAGAALTAALLLNSTQLAPFLYLDNADNDSSLSSTGSDDKTAQKAVAKAAAKKVFALLSLPLTLAFLLFSLWRTERRKRPAPERFFAVSNHRARAPPLTPA